MRVEDAAARVCPFREGRCAGAECMAWRPEARRSGHGECGRLADDASTAHAVRVAVRTAGDAARALWTERPGLRADGTWGPVAVPALEALAEAVAGRRRPVDAERRLLAVVVQDGWPRWRERPALRPEHFATAEHAALWSALELTGGGAERLAEVAALAGSACRDPAAVWALVYELAALDVAHDSVERLGRQVEAAAAQRAAERRALRALAGDEAAEGARGPGRSPGGGGVTPPPQSPQPPTNSTPLRVADPDADFPGGIR